MAATGPLFGAVGPAASAAAAASSVSATVLAGAAGGFTTGLIASGGDLKAAAIGGLTGAAFGFVAGAKVFGGALSGQSRIRQRETAPLR